MLNKIIRILLSFTLLLFYGCGGSDTSNLNKNISNQTVIKNVDISNSREAVLTKENALEYLELTRLYIPENLGISRYEYQEVLKENLNKSTQCTNGGSLKISSHPSENRITFTLDKCNEENIRVSGTINIILEDSNNLGATGYFSANNLIINSDTESIKYNYDIKLVTHDDNSRDWDYFVTVENLRNSETFQYDMHISSNSKKITLDGTYLLPDNTYFKLTSSNLSSNHLPLFGGDENTFYQTLLKKFNTDSIARIIIYGDNSELIYQQIDKEDIYKLTLDKEKKINVFSSNSKSVWSNKASTIFPDNYNAYFSMSLNNRKFDSRNYLVSYEKSGKLLVNVIDQDKYGDYDLQIELLEKPHNSQFKIGMQKIIFQDLDHKYNYSRIRTTGVLQNQFDADGIYTFKISLKEEDKLKTKIITIEFYSDKKLLKSQKILSHDVIDILLLPNKSHIAFLSTEPNPTLILNDLNGNESRLALSSTPSNMAITPDGKNIFITANKKILMVNIEDTDNLQIRHEYTLPADLRDIVVFNNYIYTLDKSGWATLYSLNLDTGIFSSIEYASHGWDAKILLNPELQSLYILDDGISPQDIDKFDISSGDAIKLYDSPYHGDYNFMNIIWLFDKNRLLSGSGDIFSMNKIESEDMLYSGLLESLDFKVDSHYGNSIESLAAFDKSTEYNTYVIVKEIKGLHVHFYDIGRYAANTIQLFSTDDNRLIYNDVLKKFYIDDKGGESRLFIKYVKFISEKKLFILYEVFRKKYENLDAKYFIYEIKEI